MVRPSRVRLLLVVAGCLALAGVLVPSAAVAATAVVRPAQSSSINDAASTRRIQLMAGGLAVLGIGLIGVTVWFWRSTRPEPEALAPLEMMGRRRWRQLDTIEQRHRLDDVRAHLNDEAAAAARETVAPASASASDPAPEAEPVPAPITASPSSPEVAVPAAVVARGAEPDDSPVGSAPPTGDDASGGEETGGEGLAAEVSEAEAAGGEVAGAEVGGDEVSGEHAKVHGDPLVRAMEKDAGAD